MEGKSVQQMLEEIVAQLASECANHRKWTALQLCEDMAKCILAFVEFFVQKKPNNEAIEEIYEEKTVLEYRKQTKGPQTGENRCQTGNPSGELVDPPKPESSGPKSRPS
ncbi:hypothetical protein TKK_0017652 [Trichogramma kaykai]